MIKDLSDTLSKEWSSSQKEVWQQELAYWQALKKANMRKFLSLLHHDMVIWPNWTQHPIKKTDFEKHLIVNLKPQKTEIELTAESILVFNNNAIVYYLASYIYEVRRTDKIIHFWVFENKRWAMIGGTSTPMDF